MMRTRLTEPRGIEYPTSGVISCGQIIGLVNEIRSVREVIEEVVRESEEVCSNLGPMFTHYS